MNDNRLDESKIMAAIDRMHGEKVGTTTADSCQIIGSGHLGYFGAAFVRTFIPGKTAENASVWLSVYAIEVDDNGEYMIDVRANGEEIRAAADEGRFGFIGVADTMELYHKVLLEAYTLSIQDGYPCDLKY